MYKKELIAYTEARTYTSDIVGKILVSSTGGYINKGLVIAGLDDVSFMEALPAGSETTSPLAGLAPIAVCESVINTTIDVGGSIVPAIIGACKYLGPGAAGIAEIKVVGTISVGDELYYNYSAYRAGVLDSLKGLNVSTTKSGWRIGQALESCTGIGLIKVNTCVPEKCT